MSQRRSNRETYEALESHVQAYFSGHPVEHRYWTEGPIGTIIPDFRVLELGPGPRSHLMTYVSIGSWETDHSEAPRLEFLTHVEHPQESVVEQMAMLAYYHATHELGIGHTLPVGRPWLPNATCDCLLLSYPYTLESELWTFESDDLHIKFAWALPITQRERAFHNKFGLENLEQRFEAAGLEYWRLDRDSIV